MHIVSGRKPAGLVFAPVLGVQADGAPAANREACARAMIFMGGAL